MSKLEQKLHEFNCRKNHEKFVSCLNPLMQSIFESVPRTDRKDAIKNLAMTSWTDGNCQPSRENVIGWERTEYLDFKSAVITIKNLTISEQLVGWLSFDLQGMHYQISASELKLNLFSIMQLLTCDNGGYKDLSWVGESQDFGIIFEYNESQSPQFEVCVWGI
ncbi:hypothetical protein [Pseudoalteromonas marina]|uniref:hypothetical protein n=1 Tax=Pseudoalteromonas marina TaxID=267375 RepID=UPI0023F0E385|nr:hypothetical protein [Pseudoalteromonas marina]